MFFPQPYAVELVHNLGQMTCIYAFKMKREVEKKKRTKGLKKKTQLAQQLHWYKQAWSKCHSQRRIIHLTFPAKVIHIETKEHEETGADNNACR